MNPRPADYESASEPTRATHDDLSTRDRDAAGSELSAWVPCESWSRGSSVVATLASAPTSSCTCAPRCHHNRRPASRRLAACASCSGRRRDRDRASGYGYLEVTRAQKYGDHVVKDDDEMRSPPARRFSIQRIDARRATTGLTAPARVVRGRATTVRINSLCYESTPRGSRPLGTRVKKSNRYLASPLSLRLE